MRTRQLMTVAPALAVAAVILAPFAARAFNPQPEPPAYGMVGIGWGQTALINAVVADGQPPPDPDSPPPDDGGPACRLVLSFVGADGRTLVTDGGVEVKKPVSLRGGAAASLAVRASDFLGSRQLRLPLRAVVAIPPPDDSAPLACQGLLTTMEIFGPLGATQVLYTPPPDDSAPPPDDNVPPPDDNTPPPDDNIPPPDDGTGR